MNAIDMLKTDHKAIRQLFARFDKVDAKNHAGQKEVVSELVHMLHDHAAIEEGQFYPAVAKAEAEPSADLEAASEEHEHMDKMVDDLAAMEPSSPNYRQRFDELRRELTQHMREEERDMLPAAKETLGDKRLNELGDAMAHQKRELGHTPSA